VADRAKQSRPDGIGSYLSMDGLIVILAVIPQRYATRRYLMHLRRPLVLIIALAVELVESGRSHANSFAARLSLSVRLLIFLRCHLPIQLWLIRMALRLSPRDTQNTERQLCRGCFPPNCRSTRSNQPRAPGSIYASYGTCRRSTFSLAPGSCLENTIILLNLRAIQ